MHYSVYSTWLHVLLPLGLTQAFVFNRFHMFNTLPNRNYVSKVEAHLVDGDAMNSESTKDNSRFIRFHGITQFLHSWNRSKDIQDDELRFGDEIEYGIFDADASQKTLKLSARGAEILSMLKDCESESNGEGCTWNPEFGAWMVESTPSKPYTNYVSDLLRVERNMLLRRRRLLSVLKSNEIAPLVTCFPLMGVGNFIAKPKPFEVPHSQSDFVPDYVINPHPRFAALVRNIRTRRGSKVDIQVPLFRDVNTPEFNSGIAAISPISTATIEPASSKNILMDCMAFGMGMCCLQVTFQARDVDESRYMYDQLAVLAPIMLAMTAATPIFKGRLSDIDCRWSVIAQCVDDRTRAERGLLSEAEMAAVADGRMAGEGVKRLPKSRYDSISTYIYHCNGDAACQRTFEIYNDIPCPVDEEVKARLRSEGVDENLAHHVAHLFTRDPIVAYHGKIEQNDEKSTDHFESIQSTNWQSCRWKPPPPQEANGPHIGWRTEFRSMEVQMTDFENAAFVVFTALITRVVLAFDLGFYIPLSKVDENFKRAHVPNAVKNQKFYFRKHIAPPSEMTEMSPDDQFASCQCDNESCLLPEDSYEEMSMSEIFNGKGKYFPGLIPLVYAYLEYIQCDAETFRRVDQYLQFIEKRSTGELMTPATWMRKFVREHKAYKGDSVVSEEIAHDLMVACKDFGEGKLHIPELLGSITIDRVRKEEAYGQVLAGRLSSEERSELVKTLMSRAKEQRPVNVPRGKGRISRKMTPSQAVPQ